MRRSVFRFKVKDKERKGIVWVSNTYSDINDINDILWVNILLLRSSLKAWRRKRKEERVQLIYYILKNKKHQTKKDKWKGSNTMGEGVSFASKWKTRNRKGIVWVSNTYSDFNKINEILWVNIIILRSSLKAIEALRYEKIFMLKINIDWKWGGGSPSQCLLG